MGASASYGACTIFDVADIQRQQICKSNGGNNVLEGAQCQANESVTKSDICACLEAASSIIAHADIRAGDQASLHQHLLLTNVAVNVLL